MILYLSQGANPRIVQLFLQEKRLSLEIRHIDLAAGEHRSDAFLCKNALGQLPVLELDNGQCISQTTAICEYLEELHPTPPLIGATAEERTETRMWLRRLDFLITEPSGPVDVSSATALLLQIAPDKARNAGNGESFPSFATQPGAI